MKKSVLIYALIVCLSLPAFVLVAQAHPGRTDSSGGHTDRSTGEYHYHHGYSAHDHYDMDGNGTVDCPYGFKDKTEHKNKADTSKETDSSSTGSYAKEESIKPLKKPSFWDVISALVSSLLPTLIISFLMSLFLSNVLFFLFGDDKGWTLTYVSFLIISAVVYVRLVLWALQ